MGGKMNKVRLFTTISFNPSKGKGIYPSEVEHYSNGKKVILVQSKPFWG
jgi:hypothetical protein